jgi:hypothetical protein
MIEKGNQAVISFIVFESVKGFGEWHIVSAHGCAYCHYIPITIQPTTEVMKILL